MHSIVGAGAALRRRVLPTASRHAGTALQASSLGTYACFGSSMGRMARVFITGSSDGLGRMAGERLIEEGHRVVLHARSEARAAETRQKVPGAEAVVVGDLASLKQTHGVAEQVNALGEFDAVIHNAAVGYREKHRIVTEDGLAHVFAVNTLAPYVLTALIRRPKRLIYVSSELHQRGDGSLRDLNWEQRPWRGNQAYSDTKLHDALLAFAFARRWSDVLSNALEPGWVPTKMGGPNAKDDLQAGCETQAWLAVSADSAAQVTGKYFFHQRLRPALALSHDEVRQDQLLEACAGFSGVVLPPPVPKP